MCNVGYTSYSDEDEKLRAFLRLRKKRRKVEAKILDIEELGMKICVSLRGIYIW